MKVADSIRNALAHPTATLLVLRANERLEIHTPMGIEREQGVLSEDEILQFVMQSGGSRYVEELSENDVQWKSKTAAGQVTVFVNNRKGVLEARVQFPGRPTDTLDSEATRRMAREMAPRARRATDRPPGPMSMPPTPQAPRTTSMTPAERQVSLRPSDSLRVDHAFASSPQAVTVPPPTPHANRMPWFGNSLPPAAPLLHERLLESARRQKASDLHIIAGRPSAFRIAGELVPQGDPVDAFMVEAVVNAILPPRLRARFEAEGSADFGFIHPELGRARTNVARQQTGLKVCFRIIGSEIPTLESLGLPSAIGDATHHHQGLIVVTGPSGHGKTSTLAAIVNLINENTGHHVITVEDPIEFMHPTKKALLSQREVGTHTRSFAAALKASLREDPEVIVVGELRDTETVRMAVAASETGHLVIGTMNTPSAAKTIDRIIDLFPPADQGQVRMTLAGGLRLIVSQRLVPTIDGGLTAAAELLPGNIPLWSLIRDGKTFQIPSLQQRGKGLGIIRIDDSLAELVKQKKITRETALRASETFASSEKP